MRGRLFFTWMLSALLLHGFAQEHFAGMAQDGTGRVWAISQSGQRGLARLKGTEWQDVQVPAADHFVAKYLTPLSDGSVACLWSDAESDPGPSILTRHRGDRAPLVTTGLPSLTEPRILERSDGSLLITESGRSLILVSKKGEARVLAIPEELYQPHEPDPPERQPDYLPVCAVEDGAHRIWLWSNAFEGLGKRQLVTFVRLEGEKLTRHVLHDFDADEIISDMVRVDAGHLWFACGGTGIYELETATGGSRLLTTEVPKGNNEGVAWVEQIFREGDDWFAVSYPEPSSERALEIESGISNIIPTDTVRNYDASKPCGRLLRYRPEGWEVVLSDLDVQPHFGWRERPHALTPQGLLIGSHESGPWLTLRPGGEPALQHSWETNFPLPDAVKMSPLPEGKMRALASTGAIAVIPIVPEAVNPRGLRRFTFAHEAVEDSRGNLWSMRDAETLVKWDGATWSEQASPNLQSKEEADWWGDDHDQGWYFGDDDKAAICDFATGKWKHYPGRDAALVAQLPLGVHHSYVGQQYWLPTYSGTGQIAWLSGISGLHVYDGAKWRRWTVLEIAGEELQLAGAPFFNSAHQVCLPLDDSNFTRDEAIGVWQRTLRPPEQKDGGANTERPVILPPGCTFQDHPSGANDSLGTAWLTSASGELFRAAPGRMVQVLAKDETNPFRFGRKIRQALVDPRGGAMLLVSEWDTKPIEYIHIPARLPLPQLTAKLQAVGGDTARVELATVETAAETWFSWQLDDGPWHALQQEKEVSLTELKAGKHRLALRAFNAELGANRKPVVLEFAIEAADVETMKAGIAALSHPTRERREAAAKSLRAQGAAALPALKEALRNGRTDGQWWVNKVIEQIEADLAQAGKTAPLKP